METSNAKEDPDGGGGGVSHLSPPLAPARRGWAGAQAQAKTQHRVPTQRHPGHLAHLQPPGHLGTRCVSVPQDAPCARAQVSIKKNTIEKNPGPRVFHHADLWASSSRPLDAAAARDVDLGVACGCGRMLPCTTGVWAKLSTAVAAAVFVPAVSDSQRAMASQLSHKCQHANKRTHTLMETPLTLNSRTHVPHLSPLASRVHNPGERGSSCVPESWGVWPRLT